MHTLVGAGSSGRGLNAGAGLDVANLLKPPLARGQLQVGVSVLATGYAGGFAVAAFSKSLNCISRAMGSLLSRELCRVMLRVSVQT